MKNFIFKSSDADLQKMFQFLDTIQKNSVYSTYKLDAILKICKEIIHDKALQSTVDKYFDETSHQTESDEH